MCVFVINEAHFTHNISLIMREFKKTNNSLKNGKQITLHLKILSYSVLAKLHCSKYFAKQ